MARRNPGKRQFHRAVALLGSSALIAAFTGMASASVYSFDETSALINGAAAPGPVIVATITVNGSMASLPTVSDVKSSGPYSFGTLLGLSVVSGNAPAVTLSQFTAPDAGGAFPRPTPDWSISDSGISYSDSQTDFTIGFGSDAIIDYATDGPSRCNFTNGSRYACVASGVWTVSNLGGPTPIPEPSGGWLLLAGAAMIGGVLKWRSASRT